ncbi:MAG TPA: hypothetical protein VFS19_05890 [Planctomycetota bacterium]|nr:hypothetical protein [Planctomycetota bacterium]
MKIRRWALLTTVLYAVTLGVLTFPLILACFHEVGNEVQLDDIAEIYSDEGYWLVIAVLTLAQSLLLLIPIQIVRARPVRRGRWITLAVAAGLMMGLLVAAGVLSLAEVVQLDDFLDGSALSVCMLIAVAGWIFWGFVFARYTRSQDPDSALNKVLDRLITGSIAELLVAVPSHVYVRNKDYCCAGAGTFLGIATGLSVMLFAFGPGVFFLFAKRVKMLRAAAPSAAGGGMGRHTRDALLWMVLSLVGLTYGWAVGLGQGLRDVGFGLGQICFAVMGIAACVHGARAYFALEPGRRRLLAGSACFAGAVLHSTLWWVLAI